MANEEMTRQGGNAAGISAEESIRQIREKQERIDAELLQLKKIQRQKLIKHSLVQLGVFILLVLVYFTLLRASNVTENSMRHIRNAIIAVNGANVAVWFNCLKRCVFNMAHFDTQRQRNKLNAVLRIDTIREGKSTDKLTDLPIYMETLEELNKKGMLK